MEKDSGNCASRATYVKEQCAKTELHVRSPCPISWIGVFSKKDLAEETERTLDHLRLKTVRISAIADSSFFNS